MRTPGNMSKVSIILGLSTMRLVSAAAVADDPVMVSAGAAGKGHVKWIARTVDPSFLRCGYREMHGVANDAMVYISANSSCRKSR
jgi:hypothetical protein